MPNTKKTLAQKLNLTQLRAKIAPQNASVQKELGFTSIPYCQVVIVVCMVNLVIIALVLALNKLIPPQIPLYYGLAEGEEQLAPNSLFLTLPSLVSLFLMALNITLASLIRDIFIKKMLVAASVATSFFSLVTSIKIFLLVGGI